MEKQVTELTKWLQIESSDGTFYLPASMADLCESDFAIADIYEVEMQEGYGARLSMPGYLDCTDWTVHDTPEEAFEYLEKTYEDYDGR